MAISLVGTALRAGNQIVTLPTVLEGDLVIVSLAGDVDVSSTPVGWTEIDERVGDVDTLEYYKIMGSTPDTTVDTGTEIQSGVIHAWRGVDLIKPFDALTTRAENTVGAPDSPSNTSFHDNCVFISVGHLDDDAVASTIGEPTGYTQANKEEINSGGEISTTVVSYKTLASPGTDDPDAYDAGDDRWIGYTHVLRPIQPVATITNLGFVLRGATQSPSLASLGLQENDIVFVATTADGAAPGNAPSGWTELYNARPLSTGAAEYWKKMGSTPDTSVDTGTIAECGVITAFRGVDNITPWDITPPSAVSASGIPDPPSATPVTDAACVIAVAHLDDDAVAASIRAPSGYTEAGADEEGTAGKPTTAIGYKILLSAAAEDPGVFDDGNDNYIAMTHVLRPAAVGGAHPVNPFGHPLMGPFGGPI